MLFALGPDDLERLAVPIGILVAVILTLAVPSLRRSFQESLAAGKKFREENQEFARVAEVIGVVLLIGIVWYLLLK